MAGFNLFNSGGNDMDSLDLSGALERKKANPGGGLTGNIPFQSMRHLDTSSAGTDVYLRPQWMDQMGVKGNIADKYSFFGHSSNPGSNDVANWYWNMQAGSGHHEQGPAEGGEWVYDAPKEIVRFANNPNAAAAVQGKWSMLNGTDYDILDAMTGKKNGTGTFKGLKDADNLDLIMAMVVGGALGGMGMTAANAGVGTSGLSAAGGEAAGYGATALPTSATTGATGVGAAGAGTAGTTTGTTGATSGATAGATGATEPVASAVSAGTTTGSSGLTGGLSDLVTKLGGANLGTLKKAYTAYQLYNALTGGKGGGTTGSTMGNTNSNGFSMNDLFGLIGGGMDAYNQNKAADTMRQWLDSNQAKMEGFMNPNSPEYNALWERMSRKDAAAGRNSQYGPRTADFAAQVAQAKASNILNFTTGNSRAYSNALNQKASSFSGLNAALQNAFGKNGGGSINLSSIIKALTDGGEELSNEDFFKMIGDEGMPIDYGAGSDDPTEEDVLDFMNRWGEL